MNNDFLLEGLLVLRFEWHSILVEDYVDVESSMKAMNWSLSWTPFQAKVSWVFVQGPFWLTSHWHPPTLPIISILNEYQSAASRMHNCQGMYWDNALASCIFLYSCWLNTETGFIWSFLGPVCMIITVGKTFLQEHFGDLSLVKLESIITLWSLLISKLFPVILGSWGFWVRM